MRLRNAPLVHVLAEIRFSPVLGIAERMPRLQEEFRRQGFPWLTEGALHTVTVIPGAASPQVAIRPRWAFANPDRTTAVVLSESSLTIHTTAYVTVEPFLELLRTAAATVSEHVGSPLVARIGLRYVDRIDVDSETDVAELVIPGLLGFPFAGLGDTAEMSDLRTETVGATPDGILAVRSVLVRPGQVLPPDLEAGVVTYPPKPGHQSWGLILDFDHFSPLESQAFEFDSDHIIEHAKRLHAAARRAFDSAVTATAIERWGPWEDV